MKNPSPLSDIHRSGSIMKSAFYDPHSVHIIYADIKGTKCLKSQQLLLGSSTKLTFHVSQLVGSKLGSGMGSGTEHCLWQNPISEGISLETVVAAVVCFLPFYPNSFISAGHVQVNCNTWHDDDDDDDVIKVYWPQRRKFICCSMPVWQAITLIISFVYKGPKRSLHNSNRPRTLYWSLAGNVCVPVIPITYRSDI